MLNDILKYLDIIQICRRFLFKLTNNERIQWKFYLHLSYIILYRQLFVDLGYKQHLLIAFAPLSNKIGLLAANSLKYSIVVNNILYF